MGGDLCKSGKSERTPSKTSAWCCGGDAGALLATPSPLAAAEPCPDVEVVFARGTFEPPGLGGIGQSFVDAFRKQAAGKSVSVYPVKYPASTDFPTAVAGIRDAANHIEATAANCPNSKIVLGGFSQGAAVAGFVTSEAVPNGAFAEEVPDPMPPEVADHVAAVVLLGKPGPKFMEAIDTPPVEIGGTLRGRRRSTCVSPTTRSALAPATARTTACTTRTE